MWQQRNVVQALRAPQQQMQVNTPQRIKIESTPQQNYQAPQGQDGMGNLAKAIGTKFGESGGFDGLFSGSGGSGGDWLGSGATDAGTGSIFETGGGFGNSGMDYPELFGGGSAGGGDASGGGFMDTISGWGSSLYDSMGSAGNSGGSFGGDAGYLQALMKGSDMFGDLIGEGEDGFFHDMGNGKGDLGMGLYKDGWDSLWDMGKKGFRSIF